MSISSSMNAGVAGLSANANKLATISDNIANSSTNGYKRAQTEFYAMVIGSSSTKYTAGGVRTTATRVIDERGPLVSTSNATDIAISGRGFLPVTTLSAIEAGGALPFQMTTTGSFSPNAAGYLTTASGHVLMGWAADSTGSIGTQSRDTTSGLTPVRVLTNQVVGSPTTQLTLAANLPATSTEAGATGTVETQVIEYYDNLGKTKTLSVNYIPTVPATGESNTWTVEIYDDAQGGALVGTYDLVFDDSRTGGGRLLSVTTIAGGPYDPATGLMSIDVASGPLTINLGVPGQADGMTQLSDGFAPVAVTRDGAPSGTLTGVEVDASGKLYGTYSNGLTRLLYQIPVVDVPNVNGLQALGSQTYAVSQDSGAFFLWDAGAGPTGEMLGYASEGSAVDVATELTQMIQTQRAYSSNAKVIQTVDEMLQETTNLKR
ncbi:flagellar hook protein FlgE [Ketogulonicigenium vulgare]|uniref:Flagellar hook protein FlgE n=1 Tax=Ketogulonicigenium vulgare (strain WSH-001) TaxID=759362 RepID=F9Y4I1_KETVW|nr:flagellar hook protein FlgE [Ketogulonicigenium vulgare]ADO43516.1 flagellar hook protein FlgE [Ketogulonicigenium vulgare Y25]AEM41794.1 Flagellar hook protein FlgE [Ketogulonicigenium vulgare WSH-001]ALJ81900.1 flagellar biosynthesis protein FlgE [Ketogulonicigenium vulgare]ANW34549.1 flagellar biosynthesis protein FlgE [Ketogulonicigenium vulgare]AOZ55551.1 flagellar hook protein FlgE [Ketogulonicigenium vulgare]